MNIRRQLLPLFLAAISCTACVSRTARSPVISGSVIDADTHTPLAGARVTVIPDYGPPKTATVGSDGKFAVEVSHEISFASISAKEGPYMGVISFQQKGYGRVDLSFFSLSHAENMGTVILRKRPASVHPKKSLKDSKKF